MTSAPAKWGVTEKGGIIEGISIRGVLERWYVHNATDEAWQRTLVQWRMSSAGERLPRAQAVINSQELLGSARWPFSFIAYYADLEDKREEVHAPGAQRYIPAANDPSDATNALIVERFLAAFPEPAPAVRFHRLHARLIAGPDPERLSDFAAWLFTDGNGGKLDQREDKRRWRIARAWFELEKVAGDAKRFILSGARPNAPESVRRLF